MVAAAAAAAQRSADAAEKRRVQKELEEDSEVDDATVSTELGKRTRIATEKAAGLEADRAAKLQVQTGEDSAGNDEIL